MMPDWLLLGLLVGAGLLFLWRFEVWLDRQSNRDSFRDPSEFGD